MFMAKIVLALSRLKVPTKHKQLFLVAPKIVSRTIFRALYQPKEQFFNNETNDFLGALSMPDHDLCARKKIKPPNGPVSTQHQQ